MLQCLTRQLVAILLIGATCTFAQESPAQETPAQYFSKDVDILVRLKEPDGTLEKIVAFVNLVQPGAGDLLREQQRMLLGRLLSNPQLTGVDDSRDWYVGVYARAESAPIVVFAIPAVNSDDMVSALGEELTTSVKERWVLYTDGGEIPAASRDSMVSTLWSEPIQKAMAGGELGVFINAAHLTDVYAGQIELLQDRVLDLLNGLRNMPQPQGINLQPIVDLYSRIAEAFFQSIKDARSVAVTVALQKNEIALDKVVEFEQDSPAAKFLAMNPPAEISDLVKLPSGADVYYGFAGDLSDLTAFGLKMSLAALKDPQNSEKLQAELMQKLEGVKFGAMAAAVRFGDEPGSMIQALSVIKAAPTEKLIDFARSSLKAMGELEFQGFRQTSTIQPDAETYGDLKADLTTIQQEYDEDADPTGISRKLQDFMFGKEGMQTRTVYLPDSYATSVGGGQAAMKDLLASLKSGKENSVSPDRKKLLKTANVLVLIDVPGSVGKLVKAASKVEDFKIPVNEQMIDALNLQPSYLGIAIGSEKNFLHNQLRVPASQVIGLTKLVVLFSGVARGGL